MADSNVQITEGSGKNIDTRTEAGGDHRQVIVLGDSSATDAVAEVRATDPDSNSEGVVVRDVNTSAVAASVSSIATSVGSTLTVKFDPGYTLGNIDTVNRVDRVHNVVDGTMTVADVTSFSARPDINRVHNVVDGTISTVSSVTNVAGFSARPDINRVHNVVDGTISTITNITNPVSVNDLSSTSIIPKSIAGSASGVSVSGNTIKSPVSSRVIKVYAINLTTTAQSHLTAKFTNGSGGSPTEFWRYALQAPSQGISGANIAVTPPGYLFATGSGETLSLVLDSASLVHYSISYFLESA